MSLGALAKDVQLLDIRTTGTLARLGPGALPDAGKEIEVNFAIKAGFLRVGDLRFDVVFAVNCRSRRAKGDLPFGRFVYRALASYAVSQSWPDAVLDEFTRSNALVHLWPYARQFVQTASAQLGIPSILLPPFRVTAQPPSPLPTK